MKKIVELATEEGLRVDLKLHDVPAPIVTKFAEKIVRPYYNGNLNAVIQDLIIKAVVE